MLMILLTLPPCLVLAGAGDWALRLWLGADFAANGGMVLRILAAGIFFSCVSFSANALLDAIGRPDATAKLILAEVAVFLPFSALMLWWIGIEGAAIAWGVRAAVDCIGKFWLAGWLYPPARAAAQRLALPLVLSFLALAATVLAPDWRWAAAIALPGFLIAALATLRVLTPIERTTLRPLLRRPWQARRLLQSGLA
jgi:O-antigen/teichoic acid export membrane protein